MKIVAGIVLYNPDEKRLLENIAKIIHQVDKVICIDNNSKNINEIASKLKSKYQKIEIIYNNENKGIAYALNQILNYAYENQYEWFLTLDQDSVVEKDLINTYLRYINEHKVAMLILRLKRKNNMKSKRLKNVLLQEL